MNDRHEHEPAPRIRRFFYHYNRTKGKMSVHFNNTCHIVDDVVCLVPCQTKHRKRQPRLVMQGWATRVEIRGAAHRIARIL